MDTDFSVCRSRRLYVSVDHTKNKEYDGDLYCKLVDISDYVYRVDWKFTVLMVLERGTL